MRICVFNWLDRENPQAGGAELHLHETFGRIATMGHDVTIICSGWGDGEPARTQLDGMSVVRCGKRLTFPLHVRAAYSEAVREGPFDVVVEDLNKIPLFTGEWVGAPLVLLVHHLFGTTAFREASLPIATATWLLERPIGRMYRGTPTISVSESTAADLIERGLDAEDITVIHNGVDVSHYSPSEARTETPTLLFLGRLKRYKRVELIVDALAELHRRGRDVRLRIGGTGDHEPSLRNHVDALGLGSHVEFLGYVSEAEKVAAYQESWVHVLMSEKEGWGLTNIEAGACGTATVASNAPGLRDSVVDGVTGILVSGTDPAILADALEPFVTDREYTDQMGSRAAEFARSLTWDRTAEQVLDFLTRELARVPQ